MSLETGPGTPETENYNNIPELDENSSTAKIAYATYLRHGFVNRHYEALRRTVEFSRRDRFYNVRAFFKSPLAVTGLVVFLFIIFVAIIAPSFTQDPQLRDPTNKHLQAFAYDTHGVYHWLGTDLNGADNLARLIHGLAYSLGLAAVAAVADILIGAVVGTLQGYYPVVDKYVRWVQTVLQTIPYVLIVTLMAIALSASFWSIVLALIINGWLPMAYQARAQVLRIKNEEYVTASRILGSNAFKIILGMLPQLFPIIIAQLLLTISGAITGDTVAALLGLAETNVASLGIIVNNSFQSLLIYPIELVWPVLTIVIFIASVQLVGNGLQQTVARTRL